MRSPIGEVVFIHPTPFYQNYLARGDGFGGTQSITNGECGLQKINGTHVIVTETEPVERRAPASQPTAATIARYDLVGWPWAGRGLVL